ncbi:uncharacterized protein LOC123313480 isoform X2 [Coccinella septempunctata]|uniref:uncharacterized protein LOC123313480 isoform X2 n=1 Tax=Coccinella septempunctata TaxID=41139 RepID=UPI001D06010F|nr:uncharacterized protein LOC123313480 isoform X2 [Coccinella septempunctata]
MIECNLCLITSPLRSTPNRKSEKEESFEENAPEEEKTFELDSQSVENIHEFIQRKSKQQPKEEIVGEGMLRIDLDDNSLEVVGKSPKQECRNLVEPTTEEYHYPLNEQLARTLLAEKYNSVGIPTFCIVKSEDSQVKNEQKMVVLGAQNTADFVTSYCVHTYAVSSMESDSLKWDILKGIIMNQPRASVEYTFKRIYNIYGSEMKENVNINENFASMILETCWNKPQEDEPNCAEISMQLKMQVVSGHPNSYLRFLWDELKHLETFIKILDDEKALQIGSTVISNNNLGASELAEKIHNLCTNPIKRRKNNSLELVLDDFRELTILDRLWSILIRCKDLIDLKNSLSTFFRIAKIENLVDRDRAVELVKDLDIEDYMVNLTLAESLKFLIAIGCEKLKNDHLSIISFHNPLHQVGLEKIWSKYCKVKVPEVRRKSIAPNQPKYFALTDTTFNKEKLALLCKLHDASEYVIFTTNNLKKSVKLSDYNFSRISNEVYQKFIFNKGSIGYPEPLTPRIVSITCDLDSRNEELFKDQCPVKKIYETKFKLHSNKIHKDESTCSILISKSPIFPKCICDDALMQNNEGSKENPEVKNSYYVAIFRMTKFGFL